MNKIALTGHTSGLGLAIHNHFSIECVFSRSNNYDLLDAKNIKSMVNAAQDCDIFINNAFPAIDKGVMKCSLIFLNQCKITY